MRLCLVLSALLCCYVAMQTKTSEGCIEEERMALLHIKAHLNIAEINITEVRKELEKELATWVEDKGSDCCNWSRVTCSNISSTAGHVTELHLRGLQEGQPSFFNVSLIGSFQELRSLDLSSNQFLGWINNEGLSKLKKLETLDLSGNLLNSSIFPSLRGLTSLRILKFSSNEISGSFPTQDLRDLKNLMVLDFSSNRFNNSIEGLCEIKNLIEVDFSYNNFNGQFPKCLGELKNLQVLDLSNNYFNDKFPSFISNLTSLTYLSLFGNYLEGSFSLSTLANHSKLKVLYISSENPNAQIETENTVWFPTFQLKSLILQNCNLNMDKGSIVPSFLLYQSELQYIDLSNNKLRGELLSWLIQNNSRLETLVLRDNLLTGNLGLHSIMQDMIIMSLSNNSFSGLLPEDLGSFLPNIEILNFAMNNFEGRIPASIGMMNNLMMLDLSHNHFSGELPVELAEGCTSLYILKISNNNLQGRFPMPFKAKYLTNLYLNNNNFSGSLKDVLANNTALEGLDISNNSISGEIPTCIGKFVSMTSFLAPENKLEGRVPKELFNMSRLEFIDLSHNRLYGSIPFGNLPSIKYLYMQKNAFSGNVPSSLAQSSMLVVLDLRDNNLGGNVPTWLDKLSHLRILSLGGNKFHGQIPTQLCKLKRVTIIDLSYNQINGTIPSCLGNLSLGMETHSDGYDYDAQFSDIGYGTLAESSSGIDLVNASGLLFYPSFEPEGEVEAEIAVEFRTKSNYYSYEGSILENMTGLDLSCNELTGSIPWQIGNLQQIRALNLSHNHLSSSIPTSFSNLSQIESLDLSYNNLSGRIPAELTRLNFLAIFNVSYNNLSGMAPSGGQFANFGEDNYRANTNLCGPLLQSKCASVEVLNPSESTNIEENETAVDMVAFRWSFIASYITILLGFITALWINAYWRMALFYYIAKILSKLFPSFPLY